MVGKTQLVMNDLGIMLIKDFVLDPAQDPIDLLEHHLPTGTIATRSMILSQDAAVNADIRMHFRRLSAGAVVPHPVASNPGLCHQAASAVHGYMIQTVEDII